MASPHLCLLAQYWFCHSLHVSAFICSFKTTRQKNGIRKENTLSIVIYLLHISGNSRYQCFCTFLLGFCSYFWICYSHHEGSSGTSSFLYHISIQSNLQSFCCSYNWSFKCLGLPPIFYHHQPEVRYL